MINLTSKLGKINNIKHNIGGKIYPQNQVILDCFMPSTSVILIWVIVSQKYFSLLGKTDMELGKQMAILDWEWGRNLAPRERQKIP